MFLIGSFSYLQVMRTYIKAYMSLNFGQIPRLTTELAALERLNNRCHHVISLDIDPIFFKLAGNKDMHNIMNEFEFRPDRTTDYGVSRPWASKKYPHRLSVSTFSLLCLIGSFWYFHVTRTSIKAWMSSNFRQIRLMNQCLNCSTKPNILKSYEYQTRTCIKACRSLISGTFRLLTLWN